MVSWFYISMLFTFFLVLILLEMERKLTSTSAFCGKNSVRRSNVGIWECRASGCHKTVAGGAYNVTYVFPFPKSLPSPISILYVYMFTCVCM